MERKGRRRTHIKNPLKGERRVRKWAKRGKRGRERGKT